MSRFDVAVIGAGVNGLTCAALLARSGMRVVVLERREGVGGLAAGDEFHPGYRTDGLLHDTCALRPEVVADLELEKHGLELLPGPAPVLLADAGGPGILLTSDAERAAPEIARYSEADAAAYHDYRAFFRRIAKLTGRLLREVPPDPERGGDLVRLVGGAWALRRLGTKEMMEMLRMPPMAVADWLNERFESELLKSGLALPAIQGDFVGPWSPGTQANLVRKEAASARAARKGPAAVVRALGSAAERAGVAIRTGAAVTRIALGADGVKGVTLESGETVEAGVVAASCDPRTTFLRLVAPRDLSPRLEQRFRTYRAAGTTAKVDLALSAPLRFAGRPDDEIEHARIGGTIDGLEKAFDAVKYRRFSKAPALDVRVPTVANPDWAPEGHHVASLVVSFAPYELDGGWDDAARERLGDSVAAVLARHAPGVTRSIVASRVLAPPDIERLFGTSGGHVHHGDHLLDQLLARPAPECARYATPIRGLFLCGSGSHPGGGLTGAPGRLAAGAIRRGTGR